MEKKEILLIASKKCLSVRKKTLLWGWVMVTHLGWGWVMVTHLGWGWVMVLISKLKKVISSLKLSNKFYHWILRLRLI